MRFLFSIFLFIATPCFAQVDTKNITGKYFGAWARSRFTYSFAKDKTFSLITAGHFGNTKTVGTFSISGDTIYLTPYPKEKQKDKYALNSNQILLIDGDSCIIELSVGYDYCKQSRKEKYFHSSNRRFLPKSEVRKQ